MRVIVYAVIFTFAFTVRCNSNDDYNYESENDSYDPQMDGVEYYDSATEKPEIENNGDDPLAIIASSPEEFVRKINDNVVLPCQIIGNNDTVQIWKKGDKILFQSELRWTAPPNIFKRPNGYLEIVNISSNDFGEYTCVAIDTKDNWPNITHVLRPAVPAKITSLEASNQITTLKSGETLTLTCHAAGLPEPVISWHKGSERLVTEGNMLIIPNVRHHDAGEYRCLADNKMGTPDFKMIQIRIEYKPVITVEKLMINSNNSFDTELKCIVHADPRAIVTWKKDGVEVVDDDHKRLSNRSHDHILIIKNFRDDDFGTYTCTATNRLGETKKDLKLVRKPAILEFVKPQKTSKDVVLSWKIESETAISEHELQYKKIDDDKWMIVKPEVQNAENNVYTVKYTLTNLEPGIYDCRVRSENAYGWSEFSETLSFEKVISKHGIHKNKKPHKVSKVLHNATPISSTENSKISENEIQKAAIGEYGASASTTSSISTFTSLSTIIIYLITQ